MHNDSNNNGSRLVANILKLFTRIKTVFLTILFRFKSSMLTKTIKQQLDVKIFNTAFAKATKYISKIGNLKTLLGEENKDVEMFIGYCISEIHRQIIGVIAAIKIILTIPPVIKDDFRQCIKYIKNSIPQLIAKLINIYTKITKKYKFIYFKLKNSKRSIASDYNLQYILVSLHKMTKQNIILLIDTILFVVYKLYCYIYKLIGISLRKPNKLGFLKDIPFAKYAIIIIGYLFAISILLFLI